MKKKILAMISVFCLSVTATNVFDLKALAQEMEQVQGDYSYLLTDKSITGLIDPETKGIYLSSGTSAIKDAGPGKIIAGGYTIAAEKCDVSINVIVERLSGGRWERVTSWTAKLKNTWSVASEKTLSVGRGYYYRVRCVHYANTDVSSSMTSSLWR